MISTRANHVLTFVEEEHNSHTAKRDPEHEFTDDAQQQTKVLEDLTEANQTTTTLLAEHDDLDDPPHDDKSEENPEQDNNCDLNLADILMVLLFERDGRHSVRLGRDTARRSSQRRHGLRREEFRCCVGNAVIIAIARVSEVQCISIAHHSRCELRLRRLRDAIVVHGHERTGRNVGVIPEDGRDSAAAVLDPQHRGVYLLHRARAHLHAKRDGACVGQYDGVCCTVHRGCNGDGGESVDQEKAAGKLDSVVGYLFSCSIEVGTGCAADIVGALDEHGIPLAVRVDIVQLVEERGLSNELREVQITVFSVFCAKVKITDVVD